MLRTLISICLLVVITVACVPFMVPTDPRVDKVKLPEGFRIDVFADGISNARSLARGDKGTIFVGTMRAGAVYAVVDEDGDFVADTFYTLIKGLDMPNGVAFRKGDLYVAEVHRILKFENIEENLQDPPDPIVVYSELPEIGHHGWKYIAFGPDDKLYVPVGAPCNICESEDPIFAAIHRMDPDGTNFELFASGVRNTVGFDWHPETDHLWFTDNGRDWLGDDAPADELNHAPKKGMHFGYPYCHQGDLLDPDEGEGKDCADYTAPAINLGPHVAALSVKFYRGNMFPKQYRGQAFIAEHGSWNRSDPIGYRISLVKFNKGKASSYETFASGWLEGNKAWGRPVCLLELPDGSLLVSDDHADMIYRISFK